MRSECLLQYLRRDHEVDVVILQVREHSKSFAAKVLRNTSRLVRGAPPLFDRFSGYEDQLPPRRYDIAVIEHFWCASYARVLRPMCGRLVLDLHNIESELARTHARAVTGPARLASNRFARMYDKLEREWLPKFDTLLVTSEADRARVVHDDVRIFSNAIPEVPLPQVAEQDAIVFSGNLEYHPNVEAVRWFAREVWPGVHAALPGAEWRLIGRNPEAIAHLASDATVTGPVDDAIVELARGRVCVVPLLSGSGTRFKILEAWAAGRAVVSTTIGAEGLGARNGTHLILADTAMAFREAVVRLWNDPQLRLAIGDAGRRLYEERFTWAAAWSELDQAGGL
jgi:glycosyltransferase involved in cell wall biosynthesis